MVSQVLEDIKRRKSWNGTEKRNNGKKEEIGDLSSFHPYKTEMMLEESFKPHYGPGIDSGFDGNEYQESSWG
jgi:hypothetical protein